MCYWLIWRKFSSFWSCFFFFFIINFEVKQWLYTMTCEVSSILQYFPTFMRLPNIKYSLIQFLKYCRNIKELTISSAEYSVFNSPFSWNKSWGITVEKIDFQSTNVITEKMFTYSQLFISKSWKPHTIACS